MKAFLSNLFRRCFALSSDGRTIKRRFTQDQSPELFVQPGQCADQASLASPSCRKSLLPLQSDKLENINHLKAENENSLAAYIEKLGFIKQSEVFGLAPNITTFYDEKGKPLYLDSGSRIRYKLEDANYDFEKKQAIFSEINNGRPAFMLKYSFNTLKSRLSRYQEDLQKEATANIIGKLEKYGFLKQPEKFNSLSNTLSFYNDKHKIFLNLNLKTWQINYKFENKNAKYEPVFELENNYGISLAQLKYRLKREAEEYYCNKILEYFKELKVKECERINLSPNIRVFQNDNLVLYLDSKTLKIDCKFKNEYYNLEPIYTIGEVGKEERISFTQLKYRLEKFKYEMNHDEVDTHSSISTPHSI